MERFVMDYPETLSREEREESVAWCISKFGPPSVNTGGWLIGGHNPPPSGLVGGRWFWYADHSTGRFVFSFEREDDAILYKLRWVNGT